MKAIISLAVFLGVVFWLVVFFFKRTKGCVTKRRGEETRAGERIEENKIPVIAASIVVYGEGKGGAARGGERKKREKREEKISLWKATGRMRRVF